jgi:hypothetical protein
MSQVRLAALAALLVSAGCYTDAPAQSTLPEPQYVAGPPGGGMDPGYPAPPSAGPAAGVAMTQPQAGDGDDDGDDDAAPPESMPPAQAPVGAAPAGPGAPGSADAVAEADAPPAAPGDPTASTASVSDDEIDTALDGYGQWIDTDDYGQVWRPDATVVGVDFTPYESGGSWAYTDAGWAFACDYPWGWLPFHYGRWAWFHGYWGWVPGHRWAPAWVEWRHGGGVVGWRPLPPGRGSGHRWHGGEAPFRDHRHAEQHDAHWRFATTSDLGRPHIRAHLYGNTAEGLRVTSRVNAPPVRGVATVRATDLMRSRFAAGRFAQPGSGRGFGPPRDHRTTTQTYQPPVRTYRPSVRTYQGPTQTYRPPVYQPPVRTYQPPARTYQGPTQSYRPPVYQPPARTYQGPTQSYRPPVYQPPARSYQPPVRSYQPPARSYQPPARSYQSPARPSPPSSSPSRGGGWSSGGSSHGSSSSSGSSHSGSSGSSSHSGSSGSSSHSGGGGHRR